MKSFAFYFLGIPLLLLPLVSCSLEVKDKKEPPSVGGLTLSEVQVSPLTQAQIVSRAAGLNEANRYQVELTWPETTGALRITRADKEAALVRGSERFFSEANVIGGSTLSYQIEHLTEDGKLIASFSIAVVVPKDLLLEGEIELKKDTKWEAERIFISRDLLVRTFEKNLLVVAKELNSDAGNIENFAEGTQAEWEKNGRSGGNITIQAYRARGLLRIHLNAEVGGAGRNGVFTGLGAHPGCAGTTGGNGGHAGNLSVQVVENNGLQLSITNDGGRPGRAGQRGAVPMATPVSEAVHPPCYAGAPDGRDGAPGKKGQVCMKMSAELNFVCE